MPVNFPLFNLSHSAAIDVSGLSEDEKKWENLGLNLELFKVNPSSAKFLIQSRLIFSIVGLKNSFPQDGHDILDSRDDLLIKSEGIFKPISEIRKDVKYDGDKKALFSMENGEKLYWSYANEKGLIPYDSFGCEPLIPVGHLTDDEAAQLNLDSHCILQVVTRPDPRSYGPIKKNSFFLKGINQIKLNKSHVALRLISQEGKVYSTGISILRNEVKDPCRKHCLATVNATLTHVDYAEFVKIEETLTTNVAISSSQFERILHILNQYRIETIRYNRYHQNCAKLAINILKIAGVNINIRISLYKFIVIALPGCLHIYNTVQLMINYIKIITERIFPLFFTYSLFFLIKAVILLIRIPLNILGNLFLITLGAYSKTERIHRGRIAQDIDGDSSEIKDFETLMNQKWGILGSDAHLIYHPMGIIQWQLSQGSRTCYIFKKRLSLDILPKQLSGSDRHIQILKEIFL